MNVQNHNFHKFLTVCTIKIKFLTIFIIIFAINASKYASIHSIKEIKGFTFSELHSISQAE